MVTGPLGRIGRSIIKCNCNAAVGCSLPGPAQLFGQWVLALQPAHVWKLGRGPGHFCEMTVLSSRSPWLPSAVVIQLAPLQQPISGSWVLWNSSRTPLHLLAIWKSASPWYQCLASIVSVSHHLHNYQWEKPYVTLSCHLPRPADKRQPRTL